MHENRPYSKSIILFPATSGMPVNVVLLFCQSYVCQCFSGFMYTGHDFESPYAFSGAFCNRITMHAYKHSTSMIHVVVDHV